MGILKNRCGALLGIAIGNILLSSAFAFGPLSLPKVCISLKGASVGAFQNGCHRGPTFTRRGLKTRDSRLSNKAQNGEEVSDLAEWEPPVQATSKYTPEETQKIGNLVADDEWMGLSMEIVELIRMAILEDLKSKGRDFLGKDDYKVGDVSKEIDSRIKDEVAKMRGKDEYELGDLSVALDTISKQLVCEMTGKDQYEFGDLSCEIDSRIKGAVARYCGKDEYQIGDLSREVDRRIKTRVAEFTNKDSGYEFGDISKEIEKRRSQWVTDFLGSNEYRFGDISRKLATDFTGKDSDISKKIVDNIFGKRKRANPKKKPEA